MENLIRTGKCNCDRSAYATQRDEPERDGCTGCWLTVAKCQCEPVTEPVVTTHHQNILEEANDLVSGDRNARYGHPQVAFSQIGRMWTEIVGVPVSAEQVALCLIAMKLCRQIQKPKHDNLVDMAGYARTIEMLQEGIPE